MRDLEGLDRDIADIKPFPSLEKPKIHPGLELVFHSLFGAAVTIDRYAQLLTQCRKALYMITVLVRNQNARQILRYAPDAGQTFSNLSKAEARINQHAGFFGFHVSAIAGRTASQNRQANRHGL